MSHHSQTTLSDSQRESWLFFTGSWRINHLDFSKPSGPASHIQTTLPASNPHTLINPDPIAWIQEHFPIPETRSPLQIYPYQQQAIRQALAVDSDGLYQYSTIVWSDIKKSIKSTITAGIVLWRAFQIDSAEGWGSIYIIANDLKQADSRVAYYVRRAIQLNPTLRERCKIRTGAYKITLPNQTFIEAIPIDPTGEAGSNADMVVFSELWGAHSKAQEQMWTESTLPPNKFGKSFRWVETYAGFSGESPLLERLYDAGVRNGQRVHADIEMYHAKAGRLFVLWNTQPRLPWQTQAYYDAEATSLLPSEFARVHRNQWSEGGSDRFIQELLWKAIQEPMPALDSRTPLVLGADAGETDDTFAVVALSRHPTDPNRTAIRHTEVFLPGSNGVDFIQVKAWIIAFCQAHHVVQICYDRYQLRLMMQEIQMEAGIWCEEFPQQGARLEADKMFRDAIIMRSTASDPGNTLMTAHVLNANAKPETDDRIRIVKRSQPLKIDAAVAASMAHHRFMTEFANL